MVFGLGFNVRECKLACIQGVNRIKVFRNKKIAELAREKKTVADYINKGNAELGMMRVEQVIHIQNLLKAIELLELFLEMAKNRIEYLAKLTEIPSDMRTCLYSLAFASSRLPDIPELAGIRKHLEARFGRNVFADIIKGEPESGSEVQENLIKYLSVNPPSAKAKVLAAEEIMQELATIEWTREDLELAVNPLCKRGGSHGGAGGSIPPMVDALIDTRKPAVPDPTSAQEMWKQSASPYPGADMTQSQAAKISFSANIPTPPVSAAQTAPHQQSSGAHHQPSSQGIAAPDSTAPSQPSPLEGYAGAMLSALSATGSDPTPILDSTNPGIETYAGSQYGAVGKPGALPAPPPGTLNKSGGEKVEDKFFPDVQWSDAPPAHMVSPMQSADFPAPPSAPAGAESVAYVPQIALIP